MPYRLAHGLETGEMNHGVNSSRREDFVSARGVGEVGDMQFDRSARDLFDFANGRAAAVSKIVHDYDVMPLFKQFDGGMRADVARPTR